MKSRDSWLARNTIQPWVAHWTALTWPLPPAQATWELQDSTYQVREVGPLTIFPTCFQTGSRSEQKQGQPHIKLTITEMNPRFLICAVLCLVAQSCPTLCDPMDCSPPGSSVHGDSPGKNTGVGCHALLQGIYPTQGSNPGLPHHRWILYQLSHQFLV